MSGGCSWVGFGSYPYRRLCHKAVVKDSLTTDKFDNYPVTADAVPPLLKKGNRGEWFRKWRGGVVGLDLLNSGGFFGVSRRAGKH